FEDLEQAEDRDVWKKEAIGLNRAVQIGRVIQLLGSIRSRKSPTELRCAGWRGLRCGRHDRSLLSQPESSGFTSSPMPACKWGERSDDTSRANTIHVSEPHDPSQQARLRREQRVERLQFPLPRHKPGNYLEHALQGGLHQCERD